MSRLTLFFVTCLQHETALTLISGQQRLQITTHRCMLMTLPIDLKIRTGEAVYYKVT